MTNSEGARLLAVCRLHQLKAAGGSAGLTAIDKRPVADPVKVHRLGLTGDLQADRKHHGGEDKALYAYAQEEATHWRRILGRPVPAGLFGENLRTEGIATSHAVIGARWRIGRSVIVEVTMPRIPCATFGVHMNEAQWVRRFAEEGLVGAYLRVVSPGRIQAGDSIEVLSRPQHGVTVSRWFAEQDPADAQLLLEAAAAGQFTLAPVLGTYANNALARAGGQPNGSRANDQTNGSRANGAEPELHSFR